jgi:hypothetical protein
MDRFGRSLESSSEEESLLSHSSRLWALKCASHCSRTTTRQLNLDRKGATSLFEAVCPCKASLCYSSFHSGRKYALILRFFLYFKTRRFSWLVDGTIPEQSGRRFSRPASKFRGNREPNFLFGLFPPSTGVGDQTELRYWFRSNSEHCGSESPSSHIPDLFCSYYVAVIREKNHAAYSLTFYL